ncbi:hypothetical protein FOCC_FOCC001769, partial [Frankliniella occidentalis]
MGQDYACTFPIRTQARCAESCHLSRTNLPHQPPACATTLRCQPWTLTSASSVGRTTRCSPECWPSRRSSDFTTESRCDCRGAAGAPAPPTSPARSSSRPAARPTPPPRSSSWAAARWGRCPSRCPCWR